MVAIKILRAKEEEEENWWTVFSASWLQLSRYVYSPKTSPLHSLIPGTYILHKHLT